MNHKRLLVIGGSGTVGGFVVARLAAAGFQVRAAGRNPAKLRARLGAEIDVVGCDLLVDPLEPMLADIDQVIYLVHAMTDGRGYADRDAYAARRLAQALAASNVRHLLYLGALSPAQPRSGHLRSRLQTGALLRHAAITVTELRAAVIIGPGSVPLELMRDVCHHLPFAPLPGGCRQRSAPLAMTDLLAVIETVMTHPEHWGVTADLAGPEILSYATQIQQVATALNRRFTPLPLQLLPTALFAAITPLFSTAPPSVVRALLGGLDSDLLPSLPLPAGLPQPTTPLASALAALPALEAELPASPVAYPGNPLLRGSDPANAFYGLTISVHRRCPAPVARLWAVASSLGGRRGYFFCDWLWTLRGWLDRMVGGPGNLRQRRDPERLAEGDPVDAWSVVAVTEGQELLLRFHMKAPGCGHLRLVTSPTAQGSQLEITAHWHPQGWKGLLYWWSLWPVHRLLFIGMAHAICRLAAE